jgi:hypothetical protein
MQSFNVTVDYYRQLLSQVRAGSLDLPDKDFDTGRPTRAGEYRLADKAHAQLLDKLASHNFENVTSELRQDILAFYGNTSAHVDGKKDKDGWNKTLRELAGLKGAGLQPDHTGRQ